MTATQARKFKTEHEIFDELIDLNLGSSVLVLDETHFESLGFLNTLLKGAHLFAVQSPEGEFETHKLDLRERVLNDLNILIGKFRRSIKGGTIIHHYLPHLLVKEDENRILAMLEDWMTRTREKSLVELYTLPRGTFPNFERKLQALCDGTIIIKIEKRAETYQPVFTLVGICKPEFHRLEYPYAIEDDKLLIRWGERFTDRIPKEDKAEIEERKNFLRQNLHSLQVVKGKIPIRVGNQYDYLIYTQAIGKRINELRLLFPEIFEELLEKLARWNIAGSINLKKVKKQEVKPIKNTISLLTRLALFLPTRISVKVLRYTRHHRMPVRAYQALREASEAFGTSITSGYDVPIKIDLSDFEKFYQEIAARVTAVKHGGEIQEDPRAKLDLKYIPKIVSLTLADGYALSSAVEKKSDTVFEIRIKDCFLCKEREAKIPICQALAATITGACSIVFKERFSCNEVKCKAMGNKECIFVLRKLS